ncbi:hypothetical protein KEM52_006209 [Ascosphaera acerosa]|nr:hypothetical protein KEM52_006209 [Ascosphaera acerosa]
MAQQANVTMATTTSKLLSLPPELLGMICGVLEQEYLPGLLAFSRVSRRCYNVASKLRFRTLYMRTTHPEQLHLSRIVLRWAIILARTDAWPYVRQLEIDEPCCGILDDDGIAALVALLPRLFQLTDLIYACKGPFPPSLLKVLHEKLPRCRLHLMSFDIEVMTTPRPARRQSASAQPMSSQPAGSPPRPALPEPTTHTDPDNAVPAIAGRDGDGDGDGDGDEDVDVDVDVDEDGNRDEEEDWARDAEQILGIPSSSGRSSSPSLLSDQALIDDDKLALATSPSLHTVVIQSSMLRPLTVNEDVALRMAGGLAPNLKWVNILTWYYDRAPRRLSQLAEESANLKALELLLREGPAGSLQGLSLPPVGLSEFMEWQDKVDFSKLHTLRLWSASPQMLERAAQCDLSSLKTFGVSFDAKGDDFERFGRQLIERLPPIDNLYLGFYSEGLLSAALQKHGPSLRRLFVQSSITPADVRQIGAYCANLYDLSVLFVCSANESCYEFCEALTTLPKLRTLNLSADIQRGTGPTNAEWARELFISIASRNRSLLRAQIRPFANNSRYECYKFPATSEGEEDRYAVHQGHVWRSSDRFFRTMFL